MASLALSAAAWACFLAASFSAGLSLLLLSISASFSLSLSSIAFLALSFPTGFTLPIAAVPSASFMLTSSWV